MKMVFARDPEDICQSPCDNVGVTHDAVAITNAEELEMTFNSGMTDYQKQLLKDQMSDRGYRFVREE